MLNVLNYLFPIHILVNNIITNVAQSQASILTLDVSGIIEKFNIYVTLVINDHSLIRELVTQNTHYYIMFTRRIWLIYDVTIIPETSIGQPTIKIWL